jgi:NAD(P)-dependent dehydrogenase (short-subunit alcohol dehydrogenase family)
MMKALNVANPFGLDGTGAVVTGASMGIGREVALQLARAGADVVCADLNLEAATGTVREIEELGRRALAVEVNVSDPKQVEHLSSEAAAFLGSVDALVNCAGITKRNVAENFALDDWNRILAVNLTGTFLCSQAIGRLMIGGGGGSIVNIASIGGMVGYPDTIAYLSSKGGVVQLTRGLGVEWAKYGITVNAIAPSVVDTPMQTQLRAQDPTKYNTLVAGMAIKEAVKPEDIAAAAQFLCSPGARFVTGHILPVDGGYLAQ